MYFRFDILVREYFESGVNGINAGYQ